MNTGEGGMAALPYIGCKISLITGAGIRYEGVLCSISTQDSTISLEQVTSFGTEDRQHHPFVPPSHQIYKFVTFRGRDISDLTVCEAPNGPSASPLPPHDPAIVTVNVPPTPGAGVRLGGNGSSRLSPDSGEFVPGRPLTYYSSTYNEDPTHWQQPQQHTRTGPPAEEENWQGNWGGFKRTSPSGTWGGGDRYGPRRFYDMKSRGGVEGELRPHPNPFTKTRVAADFNFEEANSKFSKGSEGGEEEDTTRLNVYNKATSFFDNLLSTEDRKRQQPVNGGQFNVDPQRVYQRDLDYETFGAMAGSARRNRSYNYRGGRWDRRI